MKTMYQWLGESGDRRLVVTNTQTRESIEIPYDVGIARASNSTLYGAESVGELYVAKVVADKSGRIDEIRTWLENGVSTARERELKAEADRAIAEAAALRARIAELERAGS